MGAKGRAKKILNPNEEFINNSNASFFGGIYFDSIVWFRYLKHRYIAFVLKVSFQPFMMWWLSISPIHYSYEVSCFFMLVDLLSFMFNIGDCRCNEISLYTGGSIKGPVKIKM